MIEAMTDTRISDAVSSTNDFLGAYAGSVLGGGEAQLAVASRIRTSGEAAKDLLTSNRIDNSDFYAVLHAGNAARFSEAVTALPGHIVLVPSSLIPDSGNHFFPAVVSEDGIRNNRLRLHVLKHPYLAGVGLRKGARFVLSAAGQSETDGIGSHDTPKVGVETEHFYTILGASAPGGGKLLRQWQSGNHPNHQWRKDPTSSVTTRVNRIVFDKEVPQTTLTLTKEDFAVGGAALFWHRSLLGEGDMPETATAKDALVVVQALGFEAVKQADPNSLERVKELVA